MYIGRMCECWGVIEIWLFKKGEIGCFVWLRGVSFVHNNLYVLYFFRRCGSLVYGYNLIDIIYRLGFDEIRYYKERIMIRKTTVFEYFGDGSCERKIVKITENKTCQITVRGIDLLKFKLYEICILYDS